MPFDFGPNDPRTTNVSGVNYGNPNREYNLVYQRGAGGNTPQFGGQYGLASSVAGQYGAQGEGFKNRTIGNEYSGQSQAAEAQSREAQMRALGYQQNVANGIVQSPVEAQYRAGLAAQQAGLGAAVNSAGGSGSSMAAAQRAGAMQGNANQIAGGNQAAMIQAQQAAQARDLYAQGLAGVRQGDQGMWGAMQGRELGQANLNDQGVLASQGMANNVLGGQLNADAAAYQAREMGAHAKDAANQDREAARQRALAQGAGAAAAAGLTAFAAA